MATCRLCMTIGKQKLFSVFTDTDDGLLSDKIMFCASVQILIDDDLPHEVCSTCIDKLQVAYDFRKQCELSDNIFKSKLDSLLKVKTEEVIVDDDYADSIDSHQIDVDPVKHVRRNKRKIKDYDLDFYTTKKRRKQLIVSKTRKKRKSKKYNEENDGKEVDSDLLEEHIKIECPDDFMDDFPPAIDSIDSSKENKKELKLRKQTQVKQPLNNAGVKKRGRKPKVFYDENGCVLDKKPPSYYFCEHCGKMFRNRNYLNLHIKLHSAEKTYECSTCAKKFTTKQYLTRHNRSHSDRKLYQCQYCDRAFNDWGSRQKHERLHRNEKPYTCDLCGKTFTYSYSLKNHLLVHTGIKMYGCELCKRSFTMKYHLMNHLRRRHAGLLKSGDLQLGENELEVDGFKTVAMVKLPLQGKDDASLPNLTIDIAVQSISKNGASEIMVN